MLRQFHQDSIPIQIGRKFYLFDIISILPELIIEKFRRDKVNVHIEVKGNYDPFDQKAVEEKIKQYVRNKKIYDNIQDVYVITKNTQKGGGKKTRDISVANVKQEITKAVESGDPIAIKQVTEKVQDVAKTAVESGSAFNLNEVANLLQETVETGLNVVNTVATSTPQVLASVNDMMAKITSASENVVNAATAIKQQVGGGGVRLNHVQKLDEMTADGRKIYRLLHKSW